jgi:hypothetical protein
MGTADDTAVRRPERLTCVFECVAGAGQLVHAFAEDEVDADEGEHGGSE